MAPNNLPDHWRRTKCVGSAFTPCEIFCACTVPSSWAASASQFLRYRVLLESSSPQLGTFAARKEHGLVLSCIIAMVNVRRRPPAVTGSRIALVMRQRKTRGSARIARLKRVIASPLREA